MRTTQKQMRDLTSDVVGRKKKKSTIRLWVVVVVKICPIAVSRTGAKLSHLSDQGSGAGRVWQAAQVEPFAARGVAAELYCVVVERKKRAMQAHRCDSRVSGSGLKLRTSSEYGSTMKRSRPGPRTGSQDPRITAYLPVHSRDIRLQDAGVHDPRWFCFSDDLFYQGFFFSLAFWFLVFGLSPSDIGYRTELQFPPTRLTSHRGYYRRRPRL